MPPVNGALAAQLQPVSRLRVVERARPEQSTRQPDFSNPVQESLFQDRPASKVVAMPPRADVKPHVPTAAPSTPTTQKPAPKRPKAPPEGQSSLDFLPPAPNKPRKLPTTVEAVIYCEWPVATPLHRAVASALDWGMVLLGYGFLLLIFRLLGGGFNLTRSNLTVFGAMFPLLGFTYGLMFAWVGAETPGMRWTQLRLTTFEGVPPERSQRLVRFFASCLSRCTLLGLLWSLVDEEGLAWHDHISRTFPTPYESRALVICEE